MTKVSVGINITFIVLILASIVVVLVSRFRYFISSTQFVVAFLVFVSVRTGSTDCRLCIDISNNFFGGFELDFAMSLYVMHRKHFLLLQIL